MGKKNKIPTNEKGQPHGYWEVYYENGNLAYKGHHINGKRNGSWEFYKPDGELTTQIFYA